MSNSPTNSWKYIFRTYHEVLQFCQLYSKLSSCLDFVWVLIIVVKTSIVCNFCSKMKTSKNSQTQNCPARKWIKDFQVMLERDGKLTSVNIRAALILYSSTKTRYPSGQKTTDLIYFEAIRWFGKLIAFASSDLSVCMIIFACYHIFLSICIISFIMISEFQSSTHV